VTAIKRKFFSMAWVSGVVSFVFVPIAFSQTMAVRREVRHDVSQPVRAMAKASASERIERREAEPVRPIPLPPGLKPPERPDPVLQKTPRLAPTQLAPTAKTNFPGIGNNQYGFTDQVEPPDTNGAVGATQYVQWSNAAFAVFDKSTGALTAGPTFANELWKGFGGNCEADNNGDGIVLYDKLAKRWVIAQFAVSSAPFLECVAVSTSEDATGTYNRYAFDYPDFDDYPKLGVWPDAYYVTFNIFGASGFAGADACAYDREAMLAGQTASQVCFQQGATIGGLLPADVDGAGPPFGSPNYLLDFGANALRLFKFHVDFKNPAKSTFTGPTLIPVAAFTPLCNGLTCVPQPGVTQQLDSLADRLMYRLAYRNFGTHESLVVNHSVAAGDSGGVRWYEIRNPKGTPVVFQQGTFAPDSKYRWMGSIATDHAGDFALGYSVSDRTSTFPSVAFTGRRSTDPSNTMEAEVSLVSGTGSQNGHSRWGDYSAMQVDPVDDCTFWYTQEYLLNTGDFDWNTTIGSFRFPNCSASCPLGTSLVSGACVGSCENGFVWSTSKRSCVCPSEQIQAGRCIPKQQCPPGFIFDEQRKKCVKVLQVPPPPLG
jgi:hypothetical protein